MAIMHIRNGAFLVVSVAAVLGAFALLPRQVPEPLPEDVFRNRVGEELGLTASDTLRIAAQSGNFVRVNLHSAEGGGIWAILHHTATSTEIITKGQDYPTCTPLDVAGVPVDLEPTCWADDGTTLIERGGR